MSRKTVPILLIAISALLVALSAIVIVLFTEQSEARQRRSRAVHVLLAANPADLGPGEENLSLIAGTLAAPLHPRGSLYNLRHYLSKDPGRTDFPGARDRRRFQEYMEGRTGEQARLYEAEFQSSPGGRDAVPDWVPAYIGTVRSLFDAVLADLLVLSGVPQGLTGLEVPAGGQLPLQDRIETAIAQFAMNWIPPGESVQSFQIDRGLVREYLQGSRTFDERMSGIDTAWRDLAISLYQLSTDPRWMTAVRYRPELQADLDEIITISLTATLKYRNRDLTIRVPDADRNPGEPVSPGILWSPEFSYYKNIPELTGVTADETPTIYFAKVNVGYTFRDPHTQTWLNRRKDWLTDYFSGFFSTSSASDFTYEAGSSLEEFEWKTLRLKAEAIHAINRNIASTISIGSRKAYGVRDVAFVRVNLIANP